MLVVPQYAINIVNRTSKASHGRIMLWRISVLNRIKKRDLIRDMEFAVGKVVSGVRLCCNVVAMCYDD